MYHRSWMLYHVCKRLSQTYYISTFLELHLSPTAMVDGPDKTVSRQRQQLFSSRIAYVLFIYPVEFFLSLVASVLRPIAPQLIPFAVFFLLVPLLVVPAVISGLYVWYSRAISWETPLFFQYGCVLPCTQSGVSTHVLKSDGLPPYAETQLASFNPTQPYDISLHLVVPTSPSNYDLGNFMTTLTLTGPSNRVLTTVRKPVSQVLICLNICLYSR